MSVDEIHDISKIDRWFLRRLERIANYSKTLKCLKSTDGLSREVTFYVKILVSQIAYLKIFVS